MTLPNELPKDTNDRSSLLGGAVVQTYSETNGAPFVNNNQNTQFSFSTSIAHLLGTAKNFFSPYKNAVVNLSLEGWPTVGTRFVELLVDMFSWIILARLGEATLAATTLMMTALLILRSIMAVFLYYISFEVRVAKTNNLSMGNILMAGWFLALLLSSVSMTLAYFAHHIFKAMHQPEDVIDITQEFLNVYLFSLLPTLMGIVVQRVDFGLGRALQVFLLTLLTQPLTLALGYPLVFGNSFFPGLGVAGMGYARIASSSAYLLISVMLFKFLEVYRNHKMFSFSKDNFLSSLKNIIIPGVKMWLYALLELGSSAAGTILAGIVGKKIILAAMQPSSQISSFLANMSFSAGNAGGTSTKALISRQEYAEAKRYGQVTHLMCLLLPVLTSVVFFSMGNRFVEWFIKDKELFNNDLLDKAWVFCLMALMAQIPDAFRNGSGGMLPAYGDTTSATKWNLISSGLINLPIALIGAFALHNVYAIASARVVAIAVSAFVLFGIYVRKVNAVGNVVVTKQDEENPQVESNDNNTDLNVTEQASYRQITSPTPGNNRNSFFAITKAQLEEKCWTPCVIL